MSDPWAEVVGQEEAVARLRTSLANPLHAYLLVGPPGSGRRAAARAFAGELFAQGCEPAEAERHRRLAAQEQHPDLVVVERKGAVIPVGEREHPEEGSARWIVQRAALSPADAAWTVYVLCDFHLVRDAAPVLLKTLEEPPAHVVFLVIADEITPELATIASRCMQVSFHSLPIEVLAAQLRRDGVAPQRAAEAAAAALGSIDRARLLAADPQLDARRAVWASLPDRLDGSGATAAAIAQELASLLDEAQAPLDERHARELAELEARVAVTGERGSRRRELEARHRREVRRFRTDELRFGFATVAARYREQLITAREVSAVLASLDALAEAAAALGRNPNEALLLQALMLRLAPQR